MMLAADIYILWTACRNWCVMILILSVLKVLLYTQRMREERWWWFSNVSFNVEIVVEKKNYFEITRFGILGRLAGTRNAPFSVQQSSTEQ